LRRLDLALHVLRDVHLFFIVLALAHQVCQPLSELSVRNVVPTLTSNKRQGLSLNGRC
jgi:hypothetical protein